LVRDSSRDGEVYDLCVAGASNEEIADYLGVTLANIEDWLVLDDEFLEVVEKGRTAKVGRPTKYHPRILEHVTNYCLLGTTHEEIAKFLKVSYQTFLTWQKLHPELREAIADGSERADAFVAAALFKRAKGYSFEEEKVFQHQGEVVRADVVTTLAPDVKAQQLWLLNRRRSQWAGEQKQEVQMDAAVNINIQVVE